VFVCFGQHAVWILFVGGSNSPRYEDCNSGRAACLEKGRTYLASGPVSGLTTALVLRDVRDSQASRERTLFISLRQDVRSVWRPTQLGLPVVHKAW
jgi:hypothetical protein